MNENTMKNELETCDKIETNMTRRYCRISTKISENLRDMREMQNMSNSTFVLVTFGYNGIPFSRQS
jgi:hypothetical protein